MKMNKIIKVCKFVIYLVSIYSLSISSHASNYGTIVIHGANIIGSDKSVIVVDDGIIIDVSNNIPSQYDEIINITGKYVVPALIDSHVHLSNRYETKTLIENGLSAAVDLASPISYLSTKPKDLEIIFAGPMLTATKGYPTQSWGANCSGLEVSNAAAAGNAVKYLASNGAGVIKVPLGDATGDGIFPFKKNKFRLNEEQLKSITDQAHKLNLKVAAHAITDAAVNMAADADVDILAHTPTEELSERTVYKWRNRYVITTLSAFPDSKIAQNNISKLIDAGTGVLYGTDLGYTKVPGISEAEIKFMEKAGMNGSDILHSATVLPAKVWGLNNLGHIAKNYKASFLVLSRDPREVPAILSQPERVFINGVERELHLDK